MAKNFFEAQQWELNKNCVTQTAKTFRVDTSKLSEMDLEVLKTVNFPIEVPISKIVQKRVKRMPANGAFVDKQILELSDIKYCMVQKNVALSCVGVKVAQTKKGQAFLESTEKNDTIKKVYISDCFLQDEIDYLLSKFSQPKPTPSMLKAEKEVEKVEKKVKAEKEVEKGLSNVVKGKIKKSFTDGNSSDEIAEELGIDEKLVIEYINKVKNENL